MKSDKQETDSIIVNRTNFLLRFQDIKNLIEIQNYKFIIFNAEYSNLTINDDSYNDTIEERYNKIVKKLKEGNTSLIYFEMVLFKIENNEFKKKVFKFPIMKRSRFSEEKNITLHKSTADYFYVFRNKFFNINDSFSKDSITYEKLEDKQSIQKRIDTVLKYGKPMDKKGLVTKFYFFPKEIKLPNQTIQKEIKDLFKLINEFVLNKEKNEESFLIKDKEIYDKLFSYNFLRIYKSNQRNFLTCHKSLSFTVKIRKEFEEKILNFCKTVCSNNVSDNNINMLNNDYFNYFYIFNKASDRTNSLDYFLQIIKGLSTSSAADYVFPGFNFDIFNFFSKDYFTIENMIMKLSISKNNEKNELSLKPLIDFDQNEYDLYCLLFLNIENEKEILFDENKDISFNFLFGKLCNRNDNQRVEQKGDEILIPDKFLEEIVLLNNLTSSKDKNHSLLKECLFCEIEKGNNKYNLNELIRDFEVKDNYMKLKLNPDSNQLDILPNLAQLYDKKITENLIGIKKTLLLEEEIGFSELFNFLFLESKKVIVMAHNIYLQLVLLYNLLVSRCDFDNFKKKDFPKFIDLNYLNKRSEIKVKADYKEGREHYTENLLNSYEIIFRSKLITQANNITDNQLIDGLEKLFYFFVVPNNKCDIGKIEKHNIDINSLYQNSRKLIFVTKLNEYRRILSMVKDIAKTCFIYNCTRISDDHYDNIIEFVEDIDSEILTKLNNLIKEFN